MKYRIPDSFEHAITMILAELGDAECERITGRSASLLRKASDPDQDFMINIHQALALDEAYLVKTGETPPILRAWLKKLDLLQTGDNEREGDILQAALALQSAVGQCSQAIRACSDPGSACGRDFSPNEAALMLSPLDAVERQAIEMKETVKRRTVASPRIVK